MLSLAMGSFAMSLDRVVLLLALLVALGVGKLVARRGGVAVGDTLTTLAITGVLTARVVFVLRYASDYGWQPLAWIDIRDGGFDMVGGVGGMALYAAFALWRKPRQRRPLRAALVAGAVTWGFSTGALAMMAHQAQRPPSVVLYTLDGSAVDLAQLQAKAGERPMVVNLWATWCPPCRAEMPVLEASQNAHPDVLFVFANQAESSAGIRRFLEHMDLDLRYVLRDVHGELARHVGSVALPTTLFYDANGRLVDSHLGQLSKATLNRALRRSGVLSLRSDVAGEQP